MRGHLKIFKESEGKVCLRKQRSSGKNREFEFEKNRELLTVKRRVENKRENFTNRFGKDQRFDCDLQNQENDLEVASEGLENVISKQRRN